MHEHRQSGFTLLELLVAVAVFCILAALAIPSFTTYMDKSRLRGAADDVVSTIAQARQAAVKFDRDISLATTGEGDTWVTHLDVAPKLKVGAVHVLLKLTTYDVLTTQPLTIDLADLKVTTP